MKRKDFLRVMMGAGALGAAMRDVRADMPNIAPAVKDRPPAKDRSLQLEIEHAIDKGLYALKSRQDAKGFWSTPETPGLSALVLMAFMKEPSGGIQAQPPDFVKKGYDYILQSQQPDGGLYLKGLANYSTAVCMQALLSANQPDYEAVLKRARMFLIGLQGSFAEGSENAEYNGGIGYDKQDKAVTNSKATAKNASEGAERDEPHYDVSNTSFAMEALRETQHLADSNVDGAKDLNWAAAVGFLQRCQNLPGYNKQSWVKSDSRNLGGFVYEPKNKKGLLAYGSMSYAGLLSYIHADLKKDDPRVTAVFDWLKRNYTLEENPGMGPEGLFYYYQMMSKALAAHGADTLEMADGKKVTWASELALKMINLQNGDGSWVNTSGRWWEKDPTLVTAYSVLTLETLHARV